jgi:hypothetical protein
MSKARTLCCVAEGKRGDDEVARVWVYKQGRSYTLSPGDPATRDHLCHPMVKDRGGIRREIFLVYQIKVERFIEPHELNG